MPPPSISWYLLSSSWYRQLFVNGCGSVMRRPVVTFLTPSSVFFFRSPPLVCRPVLLLVVLNSGQACRRRTVAHAGCWRLGSRVELAEPLPGVLANFMHKETAYMPLALRTSTISDDGIARLLWALTPNRWSRRPLQPNAAHGTLCRGWLGEVIHNFSQFMPIAGCTFAETAASGCLLRSYAAHSRCRRPALLNATQPVTASADYFTPGALPGISANARSLG